MNRQHLNEAELQYAAEMPSQLSDLVQQHLSQCADCRLKVENYRAITTSLADIPSPAFDFDLAGQVMAALPVKKTPYNGIPAVAGTLGVLLIAVAIAVAYSRLSALWDSMPSSLVYLVIIPALVLLVLQVITAYKDYQRKMSTLLNS